MGTSAITDSIPIGSHDVSAGPPRPPAGFWPWLRDLRHTGANTLRSDWPVAVLMTGVVLMIADSWNGHQTGGAASAGSAGGPVSIHTIASLALTCATILSALVMVLQRRALIAARQTLAQKPGASADIRSDLYCTRAAARQCSDWQPCGDGLARPVASCNAAIRGSGRRNLAARGSRT